MKHNIKKVILSIVLTAALAAALAALIGFGGRGNALADEQKAQNISYKIKLTSSHEKEVGDLLDTDRYSKVSFGSEGDTLTARLTGDTDYKLAGVYVIWDVAPGKWSVDADGERLDCGQYGFIHEYVEFPHALTELTLNVPPKAVICDLI